jgi:glycosyltransferase involved in cell wall biosynthesis
MGSQGNHKISLCALVPYPLGSAPSQRYRIEQWAPYLESQGVSVDLMPFADERLMKLLHKPGRRTSKALANIMLSARRLKDVLAVRRYDAVYIHRTVCIAGPALLERLIPLFRKPVIFDFDDAIFKLHTTAANRRFGWLKFPGKTASICRLSAHVVVGNSWLSDYARRFNSTVTIIPSSIDTERYSLARRKGSSGRLTLGWTGTSTSQTHLELFAPLLRELCRRRNIEVRVVSDRVPVLPGIDYTWRRWTPESETEELTHFDIGIMPMPDDEWSRGKCALKALQYMAMGIPTVCSAVGANCEVIQHGENGLLASTQEEWLASLETLIENPEFRIQLGDMGRRTVEERFSTRHCAAIFAGVVRSTINRRQVTVGQKSEIASTN